MKLSAVVAAKNSAERLPALLSQLALLADQLVVLVDSSSADHTEDVARSFTNHVFAFEHDTLLTNFEFEFFKRCSGDWILIIDDDETLSSAWTREIVQELMNAKRITHYYFPRRWLVLDGSLFLCNSPWYPDFSLRLFRNIPSIIEPRPSLHRTRRIAGETCYLTNLHIYHWNLIVYDRLQRERKVESYALADPETDCSQFYLYEDHYYQAEAYLDGPSHTTNRPYPGTPGATPYCVDTFIRQMPSSFVAGQVYAIEIEAHNRSSRILKPELPYRQPRNISFSHHLYTKRNGALEPFEFGASRFPLATTLPVGGALRALIDVRMPEAPGDYVLTFDLVEEFIAWFSEADPTGYRDMRAITVSPQP